MTKPGELLGDTNVLLRFANHADAQHSLVVDALTSLWDEGWVVRYAPQSLREFWNVATRPAQANGLGYSTPDVEAIVRRLEAAFVILHDTPAMHEAWRRLVVEHEVKGVQVHDARLAASALAGGCQAILTLNDPDFKRFGTPVLHPKDVSRLIGNDRT